MIALMFAAVLVYALVLGWDARRVARRNTRIADRVVQGLSDEEITS